VTLETNVNRRGLAASDTGLGTDAAAWYKDEDLVVLAQKGEKWAASELIERYQQKAFNIVYDICSGSRQDAQDLTQDAFIRVFRSLGKFRGDSSFYTWFYRIVVNTCLSELRRRRRWERLFSFWWKPEKEETATTKTVEDPIEPSAEYDPLKALREKQLSSEVNRVLGLLPEKQRLVFQLKVLHGMSIREIAGAMGTAEGTVKSHLFRATHFLREELQEWAKP
jgi:RNA polymerase sigma-70 factor, ECF subfamily